MAKLKKCPFCGGIAKLHIDVPKDECELIDGYIRVSVKCESCGATMIIPGAYFALREIVETRWNKRTNVVAEER